MHLSKVRTSKETVCAMPYTRTFVYACVHGHTRVHSIYMHRCTLLDRFFAKRTPHQVDRFVNAAPSVLFFFRRPGLPCFPFTLCERAGKGAAPNRTWSGWALFNAKFTNEHQSRWNTEAIKTIRRVRTRCNTLARSVATFKWVAPFRARLKDGLEATSLLRFRSCA